MIKTIRHDINDLHLVSSRDWSSLYSESFAMKNHTIILNYQLHYKGTSQDTSSIYLIWIPVFILYIRLYLQSHRSHLAQVKHILSSCFPNNPPHALSKWPSNQAIASIKCAILRCDFHVLHIECVSVTWFGNWGITAGDDISLRSLRQSTWVMKFQDPNGCLGDLLGMNPYPGMWGLFQKPWNKDPVIKQPGFNGQ